MISCNQIKEMLKDYINKEFIIEQKKYGCYVITPFLNHINDSLSFHILEKEKGVIQLTDIGQTLDRIDDLGINFKEGKTLDKLFTITERLNLTIDEEWNITKNSNMNNISHDICKFVTGIQEIGSLYLMAKTRTKFDFEKTINNFFIDNKIKPIRRRKISGKHERSYKVDFVFREGKLLCQTLHAEHKETASNIILRYIVEFDEIKDENPKLESMVIYNDKAPIVEANFFDVMDEKTDHVLPFKEKPEILKLIQSSSKRI